MTLWSRQESLHLDSKFSFKSFCVPFVVATIGILLSIFLWKALVLQANNQLYQIIKLQTEHVTRDIQNQLEVRISALKHMAKHLKVHQITDNKQWQIDAATYLNDYAGFKAIAWVDPNLKLRWTAPINHKPIMQFFNHFIQQYAGSIKSTRNHTQPWLSPPIAIMNSEQKGFLVIVPIFSAANKPEGYLISLISVKDLFNIQLNTTDFSIEIYAGADRLYHFGSTINRSRETWYFPATLNPYGAAWEIEAQPAPSLITSLKSLLPNLTLILGILIALLFSATVYLFQLARHRSQSLYAMNEDLKNEIVIRLQAEETKQKLEKALLQSQKLQAIGTLAGGIAHDFNNLLYAIIGFTEMAQEEIAKDSITYKNLSKVIQASQRGRELISRILTFSRRQHHEFQPISLKTTIDGVLSLLKPTIPASITIKCDILAADDRIILGNQTQLHQVMINLINNAVDAMDGEGQITIKMCQLLAHDKFLQQFPDKFNQNYCKIDISDTGYGMDQTTIERIFEPFFTTKEVGKGTGLGLSTVHAIVEEHKGKIIVTSQPGHGATFTILLPEHTKGEH